MDDLFRLEKVLKLSDNLVVGTVSFSAPKQYARFVATIIRTIMLSEFPAFGVKSILMPYFEYSRVEGMTNRVQDIIEAIKQATFTYQNPPPLLHRVQLKSLQQSNQDEGTPFENCFFRPSKFELRYSLPGKNMEIDEFNEAKVISTTVKQNTLEELRDQHYVLHNGSRRAETVQFQKEKGSTVKTNVSSKSKTISHELSFSSRALSFEDFRTVKELRFLNEVARPAESIQAVRPLAGSFKFLTRSIGQKNMKVGNSDEVQQFLKQPRRSGPLWSNRSLQGWAFTEGCLQPFDDVHFPIVNHGRIHYDRKSHFGLLSFGGGKKEPTRFYTKDMKLQNPLKLITDDLFLGESSHPDMEMKMWFEVGYDPDLPKTHPLPLNRVDPDTDARENSPRYKEIKDEQFYQDQMLYEVDCSPVHSPIRKVNFMVFEGKGDETSNEREFIEFEIYTTAGTHPLKAFHYARGKAISVLQTLLLNQTGGKPLERLRLANVR